MRTRVLVVDDSLFMRAAIKRILEEDPRLEVVAMAKDGVEAVRRVAEARPDVVTMDFNMPRMTGAEAVRAIMRERPTPVVMLSAHTREGARETIEALAAGAVDFLPKPSGEVSTDFHTMAPLLVEKVLAAAQAAPRPGVLAGPRPPRPALPASWPPSAPKVVVIGVSTGGPAALTRVLPALPADLAVALLVVQHMPAQFTATLAERLGGMSAIDVREAETGDRPRRGLALFAPGDRHLGIDEGGLLRVTDDPEVNGCRPSVDVTMKAAARAFGRRAVGLIMTGMGKDGAEGLAAIRAAGGHTIAQDRDSCVIWGMPRAAVEIGAACEEVALDQLAERLSRL